MFPYLKLLVRQRIAAWNPMNNRYANKSKWRAVLAFIGFALLALMLYGMLVAVEYFLYGAFAQLGEPQTMLALTGVLCTLMTVITSFFYIFNELFFSKDIPLVSSLPISSRGLLTAKLIRIWLGEAGIALAICLPVIVLYGIGQGSGVLYYGKAVLLTTFIPMVPIGIVTLLSFVLIRISALWKRREALTVIMSIVLLGGYMWLNMTLSMSASSSDSDNMNTLMLQLITRQRHVFDMIAGLYPPIHWFNGALTQQGLTALWQWLAFAALNGGVLAAVVALLGGAYQRLAIKQTEALARLNAGAKKRVDRHGMRTPLQALYRRELREIFIVPIYAMNSLAGAVMFPIIAVAMIASAGNTPEMAMLPMVLGLLPKPLMTAILVALFAFTTSMNMAISTAVSREGKRHEFFRTLPVQPSVQLMAKLLMGLTINVICSLPMALVAFFVLPMFQLQTVIAYAMSIVFSTATAIASLMIDVNHPKFSWKSETEAIKQNGVAALSMFGAMGFVVACGGAFYGLTVLGLPMYGTLAILCAVVLAVDVLMIRRLITHTSQIYILQEVRN